MRCLDFVLFQFSYVDATGVKLPCDYSRSKDKSLYKASDHKLYKLFAQCRLDSSHFERIFDADYKLVDEMDWLAYPKYPTFSSDDDKQQPDKPDFYHEGDDDLPDIVLDGGSGEPDARVYYANALEWMSSCMEMSCIAARNISLLIAKKESSSSSSSSPIVVSSSSFFGKHRRKRAGSFVLNLWAIGFIAILSIFLGIFIFSKCIA